MAELSRRIADLSPEKRKSFEQLVKEEGLPSPVPKAIPERSASPSLTGAKESARLTRIMIQSSCRIFLGAPGFQTYEVEKDRNTFDGSQCGASM
jgi:hypothetical protein